MAKKTGHNYSRDPYPWDEAKTSSNSASWACCDMNLPSTFYLCPICDKERGLIPAGEGSSRGMES
jgi:hypothetical protein